jgi:hypothetical protein
MSAIDGLADHRQPGVLKRHSDVIPQHGRGVDARLLQTPSTAAALGC